MSTDVLAPSSEDAPSREAPTKPRPTHPLFGLLAAVVVGVVILLLAYTGAVDAYQTFQLATSAAIFCAAAGLTVMTGLSGQISVGHGAIMAVGAYTAALMMERLTEAGTSPLLALVCSLIGAIVVSLIIGAIIGAAAARLEGPYLAGVTLALVRVVPAVTTLFPDFLRGENGIPVALVTPPETLSAQVSLEQWQITYAVVGAIIVAALLHNLVKSRVGRIWRASHDNDIATTLSGIGVHRYRIFAFIVSAGCAGLGGGLLATLNGQASPGGFGLTLSIQLLTAVVLGGLGSIAGAAIGSLVVVWLPSLLSTALSGVSLGPIGPHRLEGNLPLAIYGLVLILVMLFAPRGARGIVDAVRRRRTRRTSG